MGTTATHESPLLYTINIVTFKSVEHIIEQCQGVSQDIMVIFLYRTLVICWYDRNQLLLYIML